MTVEEDNLTFTIAVEKAPLSKSRIEHDMTPISTETNYVQVA
jgi:hypothetical protein